MIKCELKSGMAVYYGGGGGGGVEFNRRQNHSIV